MEWRAPSSSILAELAFDEGGKGGHGVARLAAGADQLDLAAQAGREHHQAHDRKARHVLALEAHADDRVELAGRAHELGRRARVQAALVGDAERALERSDGGVHGAVGHEASLARIREATVMYLRPAS